MDNLDNYSSKFTEWLANFGPKLIGALLVFIIGLYLINIVTRLISKGLMKREIDISLQSFLGSVVSVGLKILLLISVAGMLGIQTTSFVAVIGALGLAVGLALQGSLANFAGGVLILVFKPFKVGDLIESGGQTGHVQEIQIFNTILLTAEHKTVILANGGVSNNTIVNYTRHGNLRVDITMAVAPDSDIEKAREIAMQAIVANKFVLKEPAPSINVIKVGDGMISLAIRPYAVPADYWGAFFTVQEDIKNAWDRNNVSGPTPTRIIINK
ncbi:MAG TPA: mechanosensitive ion channel domain-containing protein [Flavobacterium sp.]|uniref:mechanosensitive ion channel family protein n=1 Tax=Flavobacterium sp. TaxID=239 RepID=UPI002CE638FD|nr:mechanosensitive ion channel domain-containing protein [Flavobacterium sp.]HSD14716.1 mechanosensitive ion channel domain-containing protein [Flavobacterium sp.]